MRVGALDPPLPQQPAGGWGRPGLTYGWGAREELEPEGAGGLGREGAGNEVQGRMLPACPGSLRAEGGAAEPPRCAQGGRWAPILSYSM